MAENPNEDDEFGFVKARWVRIMADYGSEGVWRLDGAGDCADELPVSKSLVARIIAWNAKLLKPHDHQEFAQEGLELARAVKSELPHFTVIFFDDWKLSKAAPDSHRSVYEYEITLEPNRGTKE